MGQFLLGSAYRWFLRHFLDQTRDELSIGSSAKLFREKTKMEQPTSANQTRWRLNFSVYRYFFVQSAVSIIKALQSSKHKIWKGWRHKLNFKSPLDPTNPAYLYGCWHTLEGSSFCLKLLPGFCTSPFAANASVGVQDVKRSCQLTVSTTSPAFTIPSPM